MKNELKSSVNLFENKPLFQTLIRVCFFAVVISLINGVYIFVDQVLIVKILINNSIFYKDLLNKLNVKDITMYELESFVRTINALSAPISIINVAISAFLALGSGITYSKSLGRKIKKEITNVWFSSFYNTLIISLLGTVFFLFLIPSIIRSQIDNRENLLNDIHRPYYSNYLNLIFSNAEKYSYLLIGFSIFNNFALYYISLLSSEGKNIFSVLVIFFVNFFNLILDYLLLRFSDLSVLGSAIATVISWIIINIVILVYLLIHNIKGSTFLKFSDLKFKKNFNKTIVFTILAVGSASLFRNLSNSFSDWINKLFLSNATIAVTKMRGDYYLNLLGAIVPIYNLFFSAIIGIIRGARTVISYNHGVGNQKRIKKSFWISNIISLFYCVLFFLLISVTVYLNGGFLWFFNISSSNIVYWDAVKLLQIYSSTFIFFPFLIAGMLYFQATSSIIRSLACSLIYGIISIPSSIMFNYISKIAQNINFYIFSPIFVTFISGLIVFCYTIYFLYWKKKAIYFEK